MSLTLAQLRSRVKAIYPNVTQIGESVLCYTRERDQTPFAVYYLDLTKDLPSTPDLLQKHLEQVLGERYYHGRSSLQWNNYLYFIADAESLARREIQKAKELIEQDGTYARKFVIAESDIESALCPERVSPQTDSQSAEGVISTWSDTLERPTLVEAVFGDYSLPERMAIVEEQKRTPAQKVSARRAQAVNAILPRIRQFTITDYRPCLSGRTFDYGDVNLLFGVNGTGKTSALEAIELYYCGKRTKRNAADEERYEFQVVVDGKTKPEKVTHDRSEGIFRDRNLEWYGIREQRRSHLYDAFGRFNFLDTDAAVDFARREDKGDDSLARLLVGADAATAWQVIEKLSERVSSELRGAKQLHAQIREDAKLLQRQIKESSTIRKQSDSLRAALRDVLQRNQWPVKELDLEPGDGDLIKHLSEAVSMTTQTADLIWITSPVTLEGCERYCKTAKATIETCAPILNRIESVRGERQQLTNENGRARQALKLLDELTPMVEAGVEARIADLASQRAVITANAGAIAGIDEATQRELRLASGALTVADFQASSSEARRRMEAALQSAENASDDYSTLRERLISLAQQLRQISSQILAENPSDECPLCHTKFLPGELAVHIMSGVDLHDEEVAQRLLLQVARARGDLDRATVTEKSAKQIVSFSNAAGLPITARLADAIALLDKTKLDLDAAHQRVDGLNTEVESLRKQGITQERIDSLTAQLMSLGVNVVQRSLEAIRSLRRQTEERVTTSAKGMNAAAASEAQLCTTLANTFKTFMDVTQEPGEAMSELQVRLARTEAVRQGLDRHSVTFPWAFDRPIAELTVEMQSVLQLASQLQSVIGAERVTATTLTDIVQREDELTAQASSVLSRVAKLQDAWTRLERIRNELSLEKLTSAALEANRKSIEVIFSQIHSPAEFEGIGEKWMLIRKVGKESTPLTRISTGQRAALALSVFLAQNAQLRSGPPVILIDDPIAHVDDLNSLSFLDYLREVALGDSRQIFFATASDKLASLFERKFDFLGERFKRFNLEPLTKP